MNEGTDLFGQVAVSWAEIRAWCTDVAGIDPDSPRAAWYIEAYDVAGKIARSKLANCEYSGSQIARTWCDKMST